jgi:hypothetical protein
MSLVWPTIEEEANRIDKIGKLEFHLASLVNSVYEGELL